ncbi:hypothetical protein Tco_0251376 [Tanacetum coccineum]
MLYRGIRRRSEAKDEFELDLRQSNLGADKSKNIRTSQNRQHGHKNQKRTKEPKNQREDENPRRSQIQSTAIDGSGLRIEERRQEGLEASPNAQGPYLQILQSYNSFNCRKRARNPFTIHPSSYLYPTGQNPQEVPQLGTENKTIQVTYNENGEVKFRSYQGYISPRSSQVTRQLGKAQRAVGIALTTHHGKLLEVGCNGGPNGLYPSLSNKLGSFCFIYAAEIGTLV